MKRLWVAVAVAPLMFAAAAHAAGPTTISTATSTPVATSTTGDLTVTSSGAITLTTAGTVGVPLAAVTIDSSNNVSISGSLGAASGLDNMIGILGIYDTNGSVIGQFTAGQNRNGIEINGPGVFTGTVLNSGGISVIGDNSAGILVNTQLTGDLISSGSVSITGGNFYDLASPAVRDATTSYGVRSTALINGNVSLSGSITATGHNATAVSLEQGVTGQLEIFGGAVTATGYRSITAPTETSQLTILYNGTPTSNSELMQGGNAVHVAGSVNGGISIDAAIPAVAASGSTPAVAAVSAGSVYAYGSSPALQIDGAGTIGQYKTSGYGLVLGGNVAGLGTYAFNDLGAPVSATAILIGGSETISHGVDITGSIAGASISIGSAAGPTANATGIHFAGAASTPKLDIGYGAQLSASSRATNSPIVTALLVDPTASVGPITNEGTITADITSYTTATNGVPNTAAGGTSGYATAIYDKSGTITSIDNRGTITAGFSPAASTDTITGSAVALDMRAATSPVTVTQEQITLANSTTFNAANTLALANTGSALTAPTPAINGDILFGSGNATFSVQAGAVNSGISFGTGVNALNIGTAGASVVNTTASPLQVKGALVNAGTLAVDVTNGTLFLTNNDGVAVGRTADNTAGVTGAALTGPINLSTLHIGATGSVIFTANATTGLNDQFNVTGAAHLDSGAQVGVSLTKKITSATNFTVITASQLYATNVNQALLGSIPYLYTAQITDTAAAQGAAGSIIVALAPRTAAQAGLNPAETSAFNAIFADFDKEQATATAMLGKTDKASFTKLYDQFLPDYAGGPFETMVIGQQAIARAEAEGPMKMRDDESRGWVQEISYVNNRQSSSSVNGYNGSGFGAAAGFEEANADGAVGVAAAFLTNAIHDGVQVPDATLSASVVEAGVYWRSTGPGLNASANLNAGWAFFQSHRFVIDQTSDSAAATLIRGAKSSWNGGLVSAQIELNYPMTMGRFYMRPELSADYVALYEGAHTESGGGSAVNLAVASKTNQEGSVQGDLVMGATFGDSIKWRPEMTIGWREIVFGGPASTTAHFASGGQNFVLSPQFTERGGLLARLGLRAGGAFADFSADAGGVFRNGYETYDARAMARFLF